MKTILKHNSSFLIGLLLSLPTAYFILINLLNEMGYGYLYNASEPMFENLGIRESFGLNINLLIVFGPVLALLLNVLSVLHIRFETTKEKIDCRVSIEKNWLNLAVIFLSGGVLAFIFLYLFAENCR